MAAGGGHWFKQSGYFGVLAFTFVSSNNNLIVYAVKVSQTMNHYLFHLQHSASVTPDTANVAGEF